jgi:hypothetical protein
VGRKPAGWPTLTARSFPARWAGKVRALNAANGAVVWRAEKANLAIGETEHRPPLVIKVIIGAGGRRERPPGGLSAQSRPDA